MKKRMIGRGAVAALSVTALMAASVPVFAAEEHTQKEDSSIVKEAEEAESGWSFSFEGDLEIDEDTLKALESGDWKGVLEGVDLDAELEGIDWNDVEGMISEDELKGMLQYIDFGAILSEIDWDELFKDVNVQELFNSIDLQEVADEMGIEISEEELAEAKEFLSGITAEDMAGFGKLLTKAESMGIMDLILDENTTDADVEAFMKEHEAELNNALEEIFGEY